MGSNGKRPGGKEPPPIRKIYMSDYLQPATHVEDDVSNATSWNPPANDVPKQRYNVRGMRRRQD